MWDVRAEVSKMTPGIGAWATGIRAIGGGGQGGEIRTAVWGLLNLQHLWAIPTEMTGNQLDSSIWKIPYWRSHPPTDVLSHEIKDKVQTEKTFSSDHFFHMHYEGKVATFLFQIHGHAWQSGRGYNEKALSLWRKLRDLTYVCKSKSLQLFGPQFFNLYKGV